MKLILRIPSGAIIENPTAEAVFKILETDDPNFWTIGSGDAALERDMEKGVGQLVVIAKPEFGFFLQYSDIIGGDEYVAVTSSEYVETTPIMVGCEPWMIPVAFLVNIFSMEEAVKEFIITGRQSSALKWVKLWDQKWV